MQAGSWVLVVVGLLYVVDLLWRRRTRKRTGKPVETERRLRFFTRRRVLVLAGLVVGVASLFVNGLAWKVAVAALLVLAVIGVELLDYRAERSAVASPPDPPRDRLKELIPEPASLPNRPPPDSPLGVRAALGEAFPAEAEAARKRIEEKRRAAEHLAGFIKQADDLHSAVRMEAKVVDGPSWFPPSFGDVREWQNQVESYLTVSPLFGPHYATMFDSQMHIYQAQNGTVGEQVKAVLSLLTVKRERLVGYIKELR